MQLFWCVLHLYVSHTSNLILLDTLGCESSYRCRSEGGSGRVSRSVQHSFPGAAVAASSVNETLKQE